MFGKLLDTLSNYLSSRKGLLPSIGILLVVVNEFLQFTFANSWVAEANLFLHLGVVIAILGFMLAWAL